ncbi:hypothetical protein ABIE44_001506 [Marmoricola sp. OAE513]
MPTTGYGQVMAPEQTVAAEVVLDRAALENLLSAIEADHGTCDLAKLLS